MSENETENSTNEISENKASKKKFSFKNMKRPKMKVSFSESYDKFQTSIPAFLGICLCAFALMCFAAFAIFFVNVKANLFQPTHLTRYLRQVLEFYLHFLQY